MNGSLSIEIRALFEASPGRYLVLSPDLRIVAASDAYLDMTMSSRDEILGRPLFDVLPDSRVQAADGIRFMRESLNRVLSKGISEEISVRRFDVRRPNGDWEQRFWKQLNWPMRGTGGEIQYIIHQVEDVTELYLAERTRVAQEITERNEAELRRAQLAAIVEASSDAIFSMSLEGIVQSWNAGAERIFGFTSNQVIGQPAAFVPPDQQAELRRILDQLKRGERVEPIETTWIRQNGHRVDTSIAFSSMGDMSGRTVAVSVVCRDITERRKAEEQLRMSLATVKSLEQAIDAHALVSITDRAGTITMVNDTFCNVSKYSREELIGQNHRIINSRHHPASFFQTMWKTISSGKIWKGEIRNRAKDGSFYWVATTIVPFLDAAGRPYQYVSIRTDITERMTSDEKLRTSLATVKSLEQALDAHALVSITDRAGTITMVNDTFCNVSKYSREELIGQNHRIINSRHHPATFFQTMWKTISSGKIWNGEIRNRAKDGSFYWVATTIVPILDASGRPHQFVSIRTDITERMRVDERLRETLTTVKSLEHALDAHALVSITDRAGTITMVNDTFCKVSKYSREELIGQNHRIINSKYHPAAFFEEMWQTISSGEVWKGEICNRAKDGSFYWVATTIVPFLDEAGVPYQYVSIRTDITERMRTDEKLRETLATVKSLEQSLDAHALVSITDRAGTISMVNDTFCKVSKYSRKELIGQNHRIINSNYHPTTFFEEMWQTITSGEIWKGEIRNRAKDGSFYWVATTIVPFLDEAGVPYQYVSIRTDISERVRSDETIRQLNASLEHRVQERTAQLDQSVKELSAFSYSVSHDLRAPLRGIDGWSQALMEDYGDQLDERAMTYMSRVRSETQRMGRLIDDLLKLTRLTQAEVRRSKVDLSQLSEQILRRLRDLSPDRKVTCVVQPGVTAQGDDGLLGAALANLFENAWKFTGKTENARIEFGVTTQGDEQVYFVRDNGAGFDMSHAAKLFLPFQRLHRAMEFPGTGIGLATVQRIILRHGGRIWAEAEVGKGATFYFTLEPSAVHKD